MGTPPPSALRTAVDDTAMALRELHRGLIQVARAAFEQERGPIGGPGELLNLLMTDPAFAWLRAMSELMADIDELLDAPAEVTPLDGATVRGAVERLISPPEGAENPFSVRYLEALQIDTAVVMTHARVRKALAALPAPAAADAAAHAEARRSWPDRRTRPTAHLGRRTN